MQTSETPSRTPLTRSPDFWREFHFFVRLAREWDLRFERLVRLGSVSKWYSSVGTETLAVAAATSIESGDALLTLHRDSGAILRYYLDPTQLLPDVFATATRPPPRADSHDLLYRLACQMLGKASGFSRGYERSYHYSLFQEDAGIIHVGMISHLGAMIPVAAGMALAFRQEGRDRVALNFIGEGGTSTGDFHEALNMAAVMRVPLVLIVENNHYAFSTPAREQYASGSLAARAEAYGVAGAQVDGNDSVAVLDVVSEAVDRASRGGGPTLIEALLGRLRGHSEGDDSLEYVPAAERAAYVARDPVATLEARLLGEGVVSAEYLTSIEKRCAQVVVDVVDRALAAPDPSALPPRSVFAGGNG